MKPTDIRQFTDDELLDQESQLERTVFNFKVQHATGQLDNTAKMRVARRDLARVKTVVRERGLRMPGKSSPAAAAKR